LRALRGTVSAQCTQDPGGVGGHATIVRMVLVPASMKLLGDANWWIPGWLDRLLPDIDIDGEAGLPAPELEVATPSPALDHEPALV